MSNVIKAFQYVSIDDKKIIKAALHVSPAASETDESRKANPGTDAIRPEELAEAESLKERIIRDAEAYAESLLAQAVEEAEQMRARARSEIDEWWRQQRQADEEHAAQARQQGYDSGYRDGYVQAEAEVKAQYDQMLGSAKTIIEQAVSLKQQIIQEAEPFLIELSCAVAEKIIGRQLTLEPEWIVDLIQKALQRKREQGVITLCVSPEQFAFVQDARDELIRSMDSQAELHILPDPSVKDHGCVIRSSFGSVDARIDTQLDEIKKGLQQLAARSGGASDHES